MLLSENIRAFVWIPLLAMYLGRPGPRRGGCFNSKKQIMHKQKRQASGNHAASMFKRRPHITLYKSYAGFLGFEIPWQQCILCDTRSYGFHNMLEQYILGEERA